MCSDVLRGRNPTNGTCMLARVPIKYQDEYEMYSRLVNRPINTSTNACRGSTAGEDQRRRGQRKSSAFDAASVRVVLDVLFVMKTYPPHAATM